MRLSDILTEMPVPTEAMRAQRYYHGCSNDERGQQILATGISPQEIAGRAKRGKLTPVEGKVYLAQDPAYALIYALGGDIAGHEMWENFIKKDGRYGWLFVIDGHDLSDIQPDEDSVGEFLSDNGNKITEPVTRNGRTWQRVVGYQYNERLDDPENREKRQVWNFIWSGMTDKQRMQAVDGFIADQAAGGKRVLKKMPDWMKLALIRWGAHVANQGPIVPVEAWRIDKLDCPKLAKDGSNVFEIAERVLDGGVLRRVA